jgi:hypothetical protein
MTDPGRHAPAARHARRRLIAMLLARGDIGADLLRESETAFLAGTLPSDATPQRRIPADDVFAAPDRPDGLA